MAGHSGRRGVLHWPSLLRKAFSVEERERDREERGRGGKREGGTRRGKGSDREERQGTEAEAGTSDRGPLLCLISLDLHGERGVRILREERI